MSCTDSALADDLRVVLFQTHLLLATLSYKTSNKEKKDYIRSENGNQFHWNSYTYRFVLPPQHTVRIDGTGTFFVTFIESSSFFLSRLLTVSRFVLSAPLTGFDGTGQPFLPSIPITKTRNSKIRKARKQNARRVTNAQKEDKKPNPLSDELSA